MAPQGPPAYDARMPPPSAAVAERLRSYALELGFCRAGLAAAGRPWGADRFSAWLDAGRHAGMDWLARRAAERLDPARLVPGARTVLAVAADHHGGGDPPLPAGHGRVARYARGRDYHNVLERRLRKVARQVREELPGARIYKCVDTGPVLERSWAVRAGVAAAGRSGSVLTRVHGPWLLLGVLVLDRELPPDEPAEDVCGRCTACLEACPTGAIVEPGLVDARRCLSYWTIEHRGPIPAALRPSLGEWLFGCDACHLACPWGRDDRPPGDPALAPRPDRASLDAAEVLGLTEEVVRERYTGSPLRRAGAEGLRRNAALRLGNAGDRAAVTAVGRALGADPSAVVRGACAWSLGRLGGERARAALERRRRAEPEPEVRGEVEDALRRT